MNGALQKEVKNASLEVRWKFAETADSAIRYMEFMEPLTASEAKAILIALDAQRQRLFA